MKKFFIVVTLGFIVFAHAGKFEFDSPLHKAVSEGDLELVKRLIEKNNSINSTKSTQGKTPLCIAVSNENSKIILGLIESGADINARDKSSYTSLHQAAFGQSHKIVKLLLDCGAQVPVYGIDGNTPLHLAVYSEDIQTVPLILYHACCVGCLDMLLHHRNAMGWTPIEMAQMGNNQRVVELLGSSEKIEQAIESYRNSLVNEQE